MLNIDINSSPDFLLVALKGNFDGSQAGPVSQKIGMALNQRGGEEGITIDLIIDISGLNYISSAGLGILLAFHRKAKESGRRMIICGPSSMVSGLLTTTGMYGVFQIQPSVASAIKTLGT